MSGFKYYGKIVVIGDSGVGKTSICYKYLQSINSTVESTIVAAFFSYYEIVNGERIKIDVWDTAGSDKYSEIMKHHYHGSCIALIMFDLTERKSFLNVEKWRKVVLEETSDDLSIIIIGNKKDLQSKRCVPRREVDNFAKKYNCRYFETSATTGESVTKLFEEVANIIFKIAKGIIRLDNSSTILKSIIGKNPRQ